MTVAKSHLLRLSLPSERRFAEDWINGDLELPVIPCLSTDLYSAYLRWCRTNGESRPRTSAQFYSSIQHLPGWDKRKPASRLPYLGRNHAEAHRTPAHGSHRCKRHRSPDRRQRHPLANRLLRPFLGGDQQGFRKVSLFRAKCHCSGHPEQPKAAWIQGCSGRSGRSGLTRVYANAFSRARASKDFSRVYVKVPEHPEQPVFMRLSPGTVARNTPGTPGTEPP